MAVKKPSPKFELSQNWPNPCQNSTVIPFSLDAPCRVRLSVENSHRVTVAVVLDKELDAGSYLESFHSEKLDRGEYTYKLEAGGRVLTRQMSVH